MKNRVRLFESQTVQEIDSLIRSGRGAQARALLQRLTRTSIPPNFRHAVAALFRRADLPECAVRLLHPIIRPPEGMPSRASDVEKAEYAAGLIRLGAIAEGQKLLESLNSQKVPVALLWAASGYVAQWDYDNAIPLFEKASRADSLDSYTRLVARVNLAGALVHAGQYTQAGVLLETLKEETKKESMALLHGNTLKFLAELKLETQDLLEARRLLDGAEGTLEHFGGRDSFLVRRWRLIADLIEKGAGPDILKAAERLQLEGIGKKYWEAIRDLDFYKAVALRDEKLLMHLYFGTPFEAYRRRLLQRWGAPVHVPKVHLWQLGPKHKSPPLDLIPNGTGHRGATLKVGQGMHRLLCALAADFYRPSTLPVLHARVFPEEYFNPATSSARVFIGMQRLRAWLKSKHLPIQVSESTGHYALKSGTGCALNISLRQSMAADRTEYLLQKLSGNFTGYFSMTEAQKCLHTSTSSTQRLLAIGVARGMLARVGHARATRYRFSSVSASVRKAA